GTNNVIWLNRFQASNGTAQIKYSITGCSGYLDEVSSDPREAVITWADGDAEPKPIQLNFLENELNLNRRLDCTFRVYLSEVEPTAAGFNSAHVLLNYGPEFLVYNNDFDRPVVHAAQALMGTSEGEKEVEIKIVRRGPPIRESVINIADTLDLTGYSRYWQFAKSGTHFDYPATAETLTWAEGDASTKSIFLSMKDDELLERDELVVLEPSGDDFDSWRYLYVYSLSDEPILLDGDIDQDGIPDREDADMDGDGLLDWWDLDRDGDGYSLESDSHWWDPNQSIDSDYDGVADNLDWAPEDPGEQFDTDSDGTGNNADTDDDGDGVADTSDAFPLDATETLDTDADGTGNNADPDDDNDGVLDTADAFPLDANESVDTDSDGTGNNADTDDDNDGVLDTADAFPLISLGSLTDTDGDGRPNECDSDCQNLGMSADTDDDGDGVADSSDAFPLNSSESVDTDSDGTGNNADTDDDGDGVIDGADAFPLDATETLDTDADGTGNNADPDDDGDGVLDTADAFPLDATESIDTDGDGVGDNYDEDKDGDGVVDFKSTVIVGDWVFDGDGSWIEGIAPNDFSRGSFNLEDDPQGCWFDDVYRFQSNGDFRNLLGDNTYIYGFQTNYEAPYLSCATPIFPYDGSDVGQYRYVKEEEELFLRGRGSFIGLAGVLDDKLWPPDVINPIGEGTVKNKFQVLQLDEKLMTLAQEYSFGTWVTMRLRCIDGCEGTGRQSLVDAFPLDRTEWEDTDGDGLGNNSDTDDDNDGVSDALDAYPLISLGELTDTDGDGRPNDCDSVCQTL
ncbi:thrombospondin type 3 repeat-containing protein, partial [Pseudomonadales bacterium]|nr:thrombospondin type 3 repeat-containing protein [Pseudomonadales bacterium]